VCHRNAKELCASGGPRQLSKDLSTERFGSLRAGVANKKLALIGGEEFETMLLWPRFSWIKDFPPLSFRARAEGISTRRPFQKQLRRRVSLSLWLSLPFLEIGRSKKGREGKKRREGETLSGGKNFRTKQARSERSIRAAKREKFSSNEILQERAARKNANLGHVFGGLNVCFEGKRRAICRLLFLLAARVGE